MFQLETDFGDIKKSQIKPVFLEWLINLKNQITRRRTTLMQLSMKLDGVGPVDNRPSTAELQQLKLHQ